MKVVLQYRVLVYISIRGSYTLHKVNAERKSKGPLWPGASQWRTTTAECGVNCQLLAVIMK